MWRSVLAVWLFAVVCAVGTSATAAAAPEPQVSAASAAVSGARLQQPGDTPAPGGTETVAPAPTSAENGQPAGDSSPGVSSETKRKLWLGAIALLLFGGVFWRNKRKWDRRKS
ncbi:MULTISPECIES: hypothetical protein [Actinosynnema]|uniref:hypothetical protein n=1 Tax=Actinosynnema TaxID=40566 RepID=UPI0020A3BC38|nr:hypothetical protein [Actinosynnema pretiosum]MCP2095442.1 hypothetical protein [Actinosynnema pretiosum]